MGREIRPEMLRYMREFLKDSMLYRIALRDRDAQSLTWLGAQSLLGIREVGSNTGPEVALIQDTVGDSNPWPWCASAIQTVLAFVESELLIKSPIIASESIMEMARKSPKELRVRSKDAILAGDIALWRMWRGGKPTEMGHGGIIEPIDSLSFYSYEGNTDFGLSSEGGIVREGEGFYKKKRKISGSKSMELLGFWRPFGYDEVRGAGAA